ncbi:MAG: type II toxin-antitoxin system RatA family toxin [Pseudomonadota bacterium]
MNSFTTKRPVSFTPTQMFDLVADVEKYPEFLPLCEALTIRRRSKDDKGRDVLVADMECGYKAIRERFTSRVTLDTENHHILVEYIDGPFRRLENNWRFVPGPKGCEVQFQIAYEFKSRMLQLLVGGLFDKAFRKFAEAFEQRAVRVYGSRSKSEDLTDLMPAAVTSTAQ